MYAGCVSTSTDSFFKANELLSLLNVPAALDFTEITQGKTFTHL